MEDVAEDILWLECCDVKEKCKPVRDIFKVTNKEVLQFNQSKTSNK